jgi:hypothetical protein
VAFLRHLAMSLALSEATEQSLFVIKYQLDKQSKLISINLYLKGQKKVIITLCMFGS